MKLDHSKVKTALNELADAYGKLAALGEEGAGEVAFLLRRTVSQIKRLEVEDEPHAASA